MAKGAAGLAFLSRASTVHLHYRERKSFVSVVFNERDVADAVRIWRCLRGAASA